jgi:hypothetical protein
MRLPKGASYKIFSTKKSSLDSIGEELAGVGFSGYIRVSVDKDGMINDGYLLIKEGMMLGAEFQGKEKLISKRAFTEIKKMWNLEGIVDIYKFNKFQTDLSVEENDRALFPNPLRWKPKAKASIEKISPSSKKTRVKPKIAKKKKVSEPVKKVQKVKNGKSSREELLKKLGLKEPEEDFGDSMLVSFRLPTERELNKVSRELKIDVTKSIKKTLHPKELDVYISSAKLESRVVIHIDVYISPMKITKDKLIISRKSIVEEEYKSIIDSVLKEKLSFPFEKYVSIFELKI